MARKILLADDSITIQKVVELTFSDGDYEVTAVNNGAKAIQKLSEMRPDIILSDIIMPEKNGYEVCEFVKSHPDYRTIPVILLTGTFEPFDPDRADKAGCDAVVTKPFESQSLIHKVDELIQHARTSSTGPVPAVAPPEPVPEPAIEPSPWNEPAEHGADIFSAPTAQQPAPEFSMPFEEPAETRAFSMGKFDELPRTGETPMPHAENPWDDTAETPVYGGETRAFPKMSYEEMQQPPAHEHEPPDVAQHPGHDEVEDRAEIETTPSTAMPWEEPAVEAPAFPPSVEPAPWEEPESSFAAETRAFPKMSYEELAQTPAHEEPVPEIEPSPWEEPAMPAAESFSSAAVAPFEETPAPPATEETPFAIEEPATTAEEPLWAPHEAAPPEPPAPPPPVAPAHEEAPAPVAAAAAVSTDLTDDQVDRIARRVVQLMSEQLVRNIAWEVIPDLAEMVVRQRIQELETEGS